MSDLNKADLTRLYNSEIISSQIMRRQGNWSGSGSSNTGVGFHDGTLVATESGDKYLIHGTKGNNSSIITPASNI